MTYDGNIEEGAVLLGQSIGLIDSIDSVKDIIEGIVKKAEERLKDSYSYIL
jgi:NAD(P)H-dependent flavin oxidoreductase YrpB (nitropropane dioxygenase family)